MLGYITTNIYLRNIEIYLKYAEIFLRYIEIYLRYIEVYLRLIEIYLRYNDIYLWSRFLAWNTVRFTWDIFWFTSDTVRCTWVTMRFTWVKVRGFVSTSPTVTIFLWHNHILIWDSSIPSSLHIMLKCLSSFCRPKQIKLYILIKKRKCITSYLFSNYEYLLII